MAPLELCLLDPIARGLSSSFGTSQSDGTDHQLLNGQTKNPDLEWLQYTRKVTALQSVWGHENLPSFSSEIDAHAEAGYDAIGIMVRFAGQRGDTAAMARIDQLLAHDPQADLQQEVSILCIVKSAGGGRRRA